MVCAAFNSLQRRVDVIIAAFCILYQSCICRNAIHVIADFSIFVCYKTILLRCLRIEDHLTISTKCVVSGVKQTICFVRIDMVCAAFNSLQRRVYVIVVAICILYQSCIYIDTIYSVMNITVIIDYDTIA